MDIKYQLKEARQSIREKDFIKVVKLCRSILHEDKDNYLALVFLGLSIQETNPSEECEKVFRRAIEINPENLLAWNGLANYYEKMNTTESRLELLKIYTFLIGKENTENKLIEYCEKLCMLYKYTNVEEICRVIYDKVERGNFSEATMSRSRSSLANVLKESNELSEDILEVYEDILNSLISNNETVTTDYYSQYLMVLYRQNKFERLIPHVIKMYKKYPEDIISMNWICKLYNELYIEKKLSIISEFVDIKEIHKKLLTAEPGSAMGMFTKAICEVEIGKYEDAKDILTAVVTLRVGLLHPWILLTRINIILHAYVEATESASFANRLMKSPKCSCSEDLKIEVETMFSEALSRSSETADWEKAIEHYEKLNDKYKGSCLLHYTRANLKLGNTVEAKYSLTRLKQTLENDDNSSGILYAQFFRKLNQHDEALAVLERNKLQNSEWFLEVGITYWETKQFQKSLGSFLKSAKSDPNNYYAFFYLGRHYKAMKQLDKARKCFEKSYKLCPTYSEAAMELSKIYRVLENWQDNIALLKNITKNKINKHNMWAWLQLGLNLMEQGDFDGAVDYLRLVARVDTENAHCWECLGDAYLYRGAYNSAQKAYERVLGISKDAMYPALQIAIIKKELRKFPDAMHDFEALLIEDRNCILTLTGLAETCLKKARKCQFQQRLGTARDYAQYAVECVTRAVKQWSDISCLWKILADCCMLVSQLPDKFCCLMIMRAIDEGAHVSGDKILEKDDLIQLAARCYCKAVLIVDNHLIWHDLAVCYLFEAKNCQDRERINSLLERSQAIVQHCTSVDPRYWQHWNLLGNIALTAEPPNFALAQHAFIRAVTCDNDSAVSWANLGVLYFVKDNIELANQAFAQAQRADPYYAQSWIGQGFLAELLTKDDAMDLFRHSLSLSFHPQGALGYGHWVCRKLMESPANSNLYAIQELHAIPVACDSLTWYTENRPYDSCAWNMLGILKERMGLKRGAAECFRKAMNLSEKYIDLARINYGRILTNLGQYKEAVKIYNDVRQSSFNSGIWYALALYKDNRFQEAASIYLAIAQYLDKDKLSTGDVMACMAIIRYILGEPDLAKNTIVESFNERLPTAKVMYALIALGVLQKDSLLIALSLRQVEVLDDVPKSIEDFITLLSYVHMYQGNHGKAIRKTSELVHLLPDKSGIWLTLALTLLHSLGNTKSSSHVHAANANKAAHIAYLLREMNATHQDISKILCTISTTSSLIHDRKSALISAQKAVHCTPNAKECWLVLNESLEDYQERERALEISSNVLDFEEYGHIRINTIF